MTYVHTYIRTYVHTYIRTYVRRDKMKQDIEGKTYQLEATRIGGSGAGGPSVRAAGGLLVGPGLKKEQLDTTK